MDRPGKNGVRRFSIAIAILLASLIAAHMTDAMESNHSGEISAANNGFGCRLFSRLYLADPEKNVFISPFSVSMALAMVYNGAAAETQQAMAETLGFGSIDPAQVNRQMAALRQVLLKADESVKLTVANSLWARQRVSFEQAFLARSRQFFAAEVKTLDFADPAAAGVINNWVSRQTNKKINTIVDQINPLTILFLINAMYFHGEWSVQFDPELTRERDFTLPNGGKQKTPLMQRSGKFPYLAGEGFQAVRLSYGNEQFVMYVFLPASETDLPAFVREVNPDNWQNWLAAFQMREGTVALPRFEVKYENELKQALTALGMGVAFDADRADFSRLCRSLEQVYLSRVKHKTYLKVNEKGTEAAAVTSAEMMTTSFRPQPKRFNLVVDHPFFLAISHEPTDTLLFLGAIVAP